MPLLYFDHIVLPSLLSPYICTVLPSSTMNTIQPLNPPLLHIHGGSLNTFPDTPYLNEQGCLNGILQ